MAKQTFTTGQVLTAAQMTSLQQTAMGGGSATPKTTSYVLTAADAGTVVQMNAAGATTITVNTALFAAGDTVQIQNIGAGVCTVTAGTATVTTAGSLALSQWEGGNLYFTSTSASIFFDIVQGSGMTNPMTTTGDTIYSSSGSTPARLGIGSTGQVLTVASGLPSWATPASGSTYVGASAYQTGSQSLTAGAYTAINWQAENWDTNTFHDNSTNPSRFTIPAGKAGYYNFILNLGIGSATGQVYWQVTVNGTAVSNCAWNISASETKLFQSVTVNCAVGDYVQWTVYKSTVFTTAGNQTEAWASINYMGA
jgi:hypothetical protein